MCSTENSSTVIIPDLDDSEEKGEWTGNDGLQKRMVDLQMQLASKNQIIENYAEELDRLNNRLRQIGGGDGSNCKLATNPSRYQRNIL